MIQNNTIDMRVKTDREQRPETGDFVGYLHALANPLTGQGKLVVASFGEDPATGKALYPKIKHYQIGDADGMASGIAELSVIGTATSTSRWQ